jgi:multiple sugar transport system permease protein
MSNLKKGRLYSAILPFLLVAPLTVWILATIFIPLVIVIKESMFSTGLVGTKGSFVGFTNYKETLLSTDYWGAFGNSMIWILGNNILQTVLAFSTALLLRAETRFTKWTRIWMIIPWVIPTIVVGIIWQWIFNGSYGILNRILLSLHVIAKPINLLGDNLRSMPTVIFINSWHWFPFVAVILLAGLSVIPQEMYEAAEVDGASKWQQFLAITLPSLGVIMFSVGLVGTLWAFNIFDLVYILTRGGPAGATTTVPVFIYQQAFQSFRIGQASATTIITAFLLLVIVALFIKLGSPKEEGAK